MKYLTVLLCLLHACIGCADELDDLIDPNIYENAHGQYYVPLNHNRPAVNAIKSGEVYELKTLQFIEKIYKKGTSVVHAGTYFGDMLSFFSHLVGDQKVFAFEPVKLNHRCASKNIDLNNLKNVNLFNMGLSEKSSQLTMRVVNRYGQPCGGSSHIIAKDVNRQSQERFEEITAISLDDVLEGYSDEISLIHLDVEGHEINALKGAKKTIEAYQPVLIVEVWDGKSNDISKYMEEINYKKIKTVGGNAVYAPKEKKNK